MKITKKYFGKIVQVKFLDHGMGFKLPIECVAVGQIIDIGKKHITLRFWEVEKGAGDHNNEEVVLVSSAILQIRVLK